MDYSLKIFYNRVTIAQGLEVATLDVIVNGRYNAGNVIRFRDEVTASELKLILEELSGYIESKGAEKTGGLITAVHLLYLETKVMDTEAFIPINKEIPSTKYFTYLPDFSLTSCVSAKYNGKSYLLPNAYTDFYHEAKKLGLKIKQPFYNVFKNEADSIWNINHIEMDIYAVVEDFPE